MKEHTRLPLLEAMNAYIADIKVPFHTPGHKMGKGMHESLGSIIGEKPLKLDLALMEELDDFHEPYGCIKEAQELAADLYGADYSYFVINGTTGAIYAMILAALNPGEKIIIPRNAHRSIIGGIILSGAIPIFVNPEVDDYLGLAMGVRPEVVADAILKHPEAKAVLIINPTYYGVATDLKRIAEITHQNDMLLLVDEAHGPHLKFNQKLPLQALDAGADMSAQSTHKIIGALTQCSLLHCRKERVDVARLKAMLQLVQSTSPSYILLASLDAARKQMALEGERLISKAIDLATYLRKEINKIPGLYAFGEEKVGNPGVYSFDPTKVTVTVKELGLTGVEVEKILRHQYKIQVELSNLYNVLFLITIGDTSDDIEVLLTALRAISKEYYQENNKGIHKALLTAKEPVQPEGIISPREAIFGKCKKVVFANSAGLICAEIVTFYPPGIPILCPGERITKEVIDYCQSLQEAGLHISGPEDGALKTIKVVDRNEG